MAHEQAPKEKKGLTNGRKKAVAVFFAILVFFGAVAGINAAGRGALQQNVDSSPGPGADEYIPIYYDHFDRAQAWALQQGFDLLDYDTMEERNVLGAYIDLLEEAPETIALGSSRVLQMTAETAGTGSFYNCGLSGADLRDILTTYYLFERSGKLPRNLVISLDPWLLNSSPDAYNPRSNEALFQEFQYRSLNTLEVPVAAASAAAEEPVREGEPWWALLNPFAVPGSLAALAGGGNKNGESAPAAVPDPVAAHNVPLAEGDILEQNVNVKRSDGSVMYSQLYRNVWQQTVDDRARTDAGNFMRMEDYTEPDADLCRLFTAFIEHVQNAGINIIFLMAPYHPLVYNYATENAGAFTGFFLTQEWYIRFALARSIPLYGSYNPFVAGTLEHNFYDGLHLKREAFSTVFPGLPAALRAQRQGTAVSPWYQTDAVPVQSEIAQAITLSRYEIGAPEVLVPSGTVEVAGKSCYWLLRYSGEPSYLDAEEAGAAPAKADANPAGEDAATEAGLPRAPTEEDRDNHSEIHLVGPDAPQAPATSADSVLLAQYAVCQQTGTIYRLDDTLMAWVVDDRF